MTRHDPPLRILGVALLLSWFSLPSVAQELRGRWAGYLRAEGDEVGLRVEFDENGGARFTVPHFGWHDLRAESREEEGAIRLELPVYSERAHLTLAREDDALTGSFRGWGTEGTTRLERADHRRPPLQREALVFENRGHEFSGTLLLPEGDGPFPAVVWTHGSGTVTDEDPIYRSLAAWLAENGVAGLIYDKRPPTPDASMQVLGSDAVRGARALRAHARIASDLVGVGGMSQGGWISPIAAAQSEEIGFVLGFSAPGVSPGEQNVFNQRNKVLNAGFDDAIADEATRILEAVYAYLRTGDGRPEVERELERASRLPWFRAAYELPIWRRELPPAPWRYRDALDFDVGPDWTSLAVPVACVWGGADDVVPPRVSRRKIEGWLAEGSARELILLEGASHDLRLPPAEPWNLGAIPPGMNRIPRFVRELGREPSELPPTRRGDETRSFHGRAIKDPYQWMERDGEEIRAWAADQDDLTTLAFEDDPVVDEMRERMIALSEFAHAMVPRVAGGVWSMGEKGPGENYTYVWTQTDEERAAGEAPRLFLDPHAHSASPDAPVAMGRLRPSPDGRYAYYGASSRTMPSCVRIVEMASGRDLASDVLPVQHWPWRVCWLADGEALLYSRGGTVHLHRLGTNVLDDPVLFRAASDTTPELVVQASADGSTLFVTAFHPDDDTTTVYAREVGDALERESADGWTELLGATPGRYQVLGKRGERVFVYTTYDAPNGRVVSQPLTRPGLEHWRDAIPEQAEAVFDGNHPIRPTVALFGDRVVALYTREGRMLLRVHDLDGEQRHVVAHEEFSAIESGLIGHPDVPVVRYDARSMFALGTVFELDLVSGERTVIARAETLFDPDDFELRRVTYGSTGGERIPMYLAHEKGLVRDGRNPTLVSNWASMGLVPRPMYLVELQAWVERGGVVAIPAARGTGEYGAEWQRAGTGVNKLTSIDDFGAAARWLTQSGYASADHIGILGSSMNGPASAAVFLRHADSFGAGLMSIPRIDLLATRSWVEEYGDPSEPAGFAAMAEWLPLLNAKPRRYPPLLVQVGSEDRVAPPYHGYKLVAAVQEAQRGVSPTYLQVVWGVGHSLGSGVPARCGTLAVQYAFLARVLGL